MAGRISAWNFEVGICIAMNDFLRVNNGAAFGAEVFEPGDANALRTNGELLFRNHATRLGWTEVDYTSLDTEATAKPGPLVWNEMIGAYAAISPTTGSPTEFGTLLCAGPNSPPFLSRLTNVPTDFPSALGGNAVLFGNTTTGTHTAVFTLASNGNAVGVADSTDLVTWTTRVANAGTFFIHAGAAYVPCRVTNAITVLAGSVGTSAALMFINNTAAGVYTTAIGTGPATSSVRKIATNGTIVIGMCSTGATGIQCSNTGVVSTLSTPFHADAAGNSSLVAYDPRIEAFVRLTVGAASPNTNALYFATSASGTTWSATTGWRRVQLPSWSSSITVDDFTITPDGIWVAICRPVSSATEATPRLVYSMDAGANWAVQSLGTFFDTDTVSAPWRFGSPGPGLIAVRQDSASIVGVLTGGMRSTGTEIPSTVVS